MSRISAIGFQKILTWTFLMIIFYFIAYSILISFESLLGTSMHLELKILLESIFGTLYVIGLYQMRHLVTKTKRRKRK